MFEWSQPALQPPINNRKGKTDMTAYDYENQRWVEGREALLIRQRQLNEEIALLSSGERWDTYALWCNSDAGRTVLLDEARRELGHVERELRQLPVKTIWDSEGRNGESLLICPPPAGWTEIEGGAEQ